MTTPPTEPTVGPSVLQHKFRLAELLDLDSFREVALSYADLFQIGFKVFDDDREMLVDARGAAVDFCAYLFQFPEGKTRCMREVSNIRSLTLEDQPVEFNCFSGLRYLIAPIRHEGDLVGRVVYGPFRPVATAFQNLQSLGQRFDEKIAEQLAQKVPQGRPEIVRKVVSHLVQVIEVILHTGYKQLLTSRMHVEAASAGYAELQEKNTKLRESYERLKELDRLKSNFLATVSHELRTPLTSVIGYSEMLLEGLAGELNAEQREYIGTIMEKGENLLTLISGILDYSKVESGNLRLQAEASDLRPILQASIQTISPLARKREIQVSTAVPADLPTLVIDPLKVRQALVNILGNAVKFNKPKGQIRVEADQVERPRHRGPDEDVPAAFAPPDARFLRIAVLDTGIGIPKDQIGRIFDSFYQVDGSSTREYGGTGLGLAISAAYINAHGGSIEVESEPGKGSKFAILLPLEPSGEVT